MQRPEKGNVRTFKDIREYLSMLQSKCRQPRVARILVSIRPSGFSVEGAEYFASTRIVKMA